MQVFKWIITMSYVCSNHRWCRWIVAFSLCRLAVGADSLSWDPLQPIRGRTEIEGHRLRAATMVMEARILERRGEFTRSLRKYQRAWRLDPDARVVGHANSGRSAPAERGQHR